MPQDWRDTRRTSFESLCSCCWEISKEERGTRTINTLWTIVKFHFIIFDITIIVLLPYYIMIDLKNIYKKINITLLILYYTILYHIKPYLMIVYHTSPFYTILCPSLPYHTVSYYAKLYQTMPYFIILYHTSPYYTILYHTWSYYTIP